MVWEPLHTHTHTHTNLDTDLTPFHKNELKIDHKPKCKTQTINVKKYMIKNLNDLKLWQNFR